MRENIKSFRVFADTAADIEFEDRKLLSKAGHQILLRYYSLNKEIKPLIIFFPGNGFIYALFEENHRIIRKIATVMRGWWITS